MEALQTWVPPRWLSPTVAFVAMVLLLIVSGYIYRPSLLIIWPLAGIALIAATYITGEWNYGDRPSQQAFLGVMHIIFPPIAAAWWISDRRHANETGTGQVVEDPAAGLIGAIVRSVIAIIVVVACVVGLILLIAATS